MTARFSLQWRIVLITFVMLTLTAVIAGAWAFYASRSESRELFDEYLANTATAFAEMNVKPQRYYQSGDDDGLWIDVFYDKNHELSHLPLGTSRSLIDGEYFHVHHLHDNGKSVIIRQRLDGQNELATLSALNSLLPILAVCVALMLMLPITIWYGFRPVRRATKALAKREKHDLSTLDLDNFPKEITPFAVAMNALLDKAKHDIDTQKRFIADASHELRSPLTAISLQVQRLHNQHDLDKIHAGLTKLTEHISKNQQLIEELLTLARLNADIKSPTELGVADIVKEAMGFLLPIIEGKNLAVDVAQVADFGVKIAHTPLLQLIKNLLQNAVLYTPEGGRIAVKLGEAIPSHATLVIGKGKQSTKNTNPKTLQIHDSGVGITPADYHAVFEPFVRLSDSDRSDTSTSKGTGLGLAMVKTVCEEADIDVYFGKSEFGGLMVGLVF